VAGRVGDPSMGGVGGGIMARAYPQAWANLINACAHLEKRGAGKGLGEGMGIITHEGAAAMAHATCGPVHTQPDAQALANMLWGLSQFKWNEPGIDWDVGMCLHGAQQQQCAAGCSQRACSVGQVCVV